MSSKQLRWAHFSYYNIQWNLQFNIHFLLYNYIERLFSLRRLKCTSIIEKGPQSLSFTERFFPIVQSVRFYCMYVPMYVHIMQGCS